METKAFYKSKTNWVAFLALLTPVVTRFWPDGGEWLSENPDTAIAVVGGLFGALRFVTKDKVSLFGDEP